MYRTPWTKPASSFPSDRLKPVAKSQGSSSKNKNNKGNLASKDSGSSTPRPTDSEAGNGKSKEVKRLQGFLQALQSTSGLDPKGGCYCLARIHDISPYTPICRSCGLILCSLNQPYYCCPSCHKPLLSKTTTTTTAAAATSSLTHEAIIAQVESHIATTISQEIEDRQRALDEARKVAGAFPALPPSTGTTTHPEQRPNPANQTHKVLSLTGNKTKKTVTVSSYSTKHPSQSGSVTPNADDEPTRQGAPKPPPISTKRPDPKRPFENFLHGSVTYKPCVTQFVSKGLGGTACLSPKGRVERSIRPLVISSPSSGSV